MDDTEVAVESKARREAQLLRKRENYKVNRDKNLAYQKQYYTTNCEKLKANRKEQYKISRVEEIAYRNAYRKANSQKVKTYQQAYHQFKHAELLILRRIYCKANAEKLKLSQKAYNQANPEKRCAIARKRRAQKFALMGHATPKQVQDRWLYYGGKCWMCGATATCTDHVKPLAKGGSDLAANLRPACGSCNSRKGAKWPYPLHKVVVL